MTDRDRIDVSGPLGGEPFELQLCRALGLDYAKLEAAIEDIAQSAFAEMQEQGTERTLDDVRAYIRRYVYGE